MSNPPHENCQKSNDRNFDLKNEDFYYNMYYIEMFLSIQGSIWKTCLWDLYMWNFDFSVEIAISYFQILLQKLSQSTF